MAEERLALRRSAAVQPCAAAQMVPAGHAATVYLAAVSAAYAVLRGSGAAPAAKASAAGVKDGER